MDDLGFISKLGKLPKSGRIVASTVGVLGAIALLTSNNKREVFNHEEHDEIDELIEDLDKLTAFCIGFLHDGAYGGESLGREDLGDGMEEERVRYVEGSIELKFVYEDGEVILIRASYPNEENGPVIYLPPPKFIRDKPEDERTRMGAEYTPSQTLSDYTPEQLATSSTITGDFTQDAVKYSNTRYAAEYEIVISDGDKVGYNIIKALAKDLIYWEYIEGRFRIPKGEEVGYHIIDKLNRAGIDYIAVQRAETFEAESDEATLKKYEKTYGKDGAKVRLRLKKKIMKQNTHGTKSGQWSARKSQKLNKEYEEEMEKKGKKAYKSSKRTSAQKDLKKWGDQKWRTKSGKKSSVTGERYLPDKAIKALTDKEYKKTTAAKRKAKKAGKQFSKQPKSIAKKVAKYRAENFNGEVYEDANSMDINKSFEGLSNMKFVSFPQYTDNLFDSSMYWESDDGNARGIMSYDLGVIQIPNFEISKNVRNKGMAREYLLEMIDNAQYEYDGDAEIQVIDVDKKAEGFWQKMLDEKIIDGWNKGSYEYFSAEYKVGTQGPCWDGYTYVGPEPLAKGSCRRD